MKFSKKILAAFLAALMAISMMPFTVFAAPPGSSDSGISGGGITGNPITVGNGNFLTFTGTDSFSIKTNNSAKNWNGTLEYSTNANTWTTWNGTQISSDNNVLYLRGTGNTQITGSNTSNRWVITTQGTVACSGDIRTLLDYAEPESSDMGTYCFSNMFKIWTSLTAAPELPATILAGNCYSDMFAGCTSLTTAPELPATTLAADCYSYMFYGCANLTTAPELPATTLAENCYRNMFNGCTSLTTPSKLPATDLTSSCYRNMFNGCTGIKLSTEQTAEYSIPYSIPKEGTGSMGTDALTNMFSNTGGTFTGTPTINTTYYIPAPEPEPTVTWDAATENIQIGWKGETEYAASYTKDAITVTANTSIGAYTYINGTVFSLNQNMSTGGYLFENSVANFSKIQIVFNAEITSTNFNGIDTEWTLDSSKKILTWEGDSNSVDLTAWWIESNGYNGVAELNRIEFTYEEPAPTSTVSFTKVTDASQITAENISTCSMEEAAAWIVANWDDIFDGEFIDVAYYDSSTGSLVVFVISPDTDKKSFEDYYENFIYSEMSADNLKNWFETYGDTVYLCTPAAPAEPNNGASITVAETISENFYLDDEFYGETAYVTFTYNHNSNVSESAAVSTDVMAMSSLDDSTDGRKKFSITQAPAQATEPIAIKIYASEAAMNSGSDPIDTIDYSVYTYCRDIIENYNGEKAEEMKELAKSTLDYAAAAQTYFNYNTDNMATVDATGDFYNNVAGADFSSVPGVTAAPGCIKRVSIVVKSDLEINLYSLDPIEVTGKSIEADAPRFNAETGEKNGDYYCVHIAGIDAANMNKTFTVTTSEGPITMTANTVIKMMAGSSNANLATLAKAMYLYGAAASAYFD